MCVQIAMRIFFVKKKKKREKIYLFVGGVGVYATDVADSSLNIVVLEVLLERLLDTPG